MNHRPEFLAGLLLSAFVIGIVFGEWLGLAAVVTFAAAGICFGLAVNRFRTICLVFAIAVFSGGVRYVAYTQMAFNDISQLSEQVEGFSGWICQEPEVKNDKIRFFVQCQRAMLDNQEVPVSGKVIVYVPVDNAINAASYEYADRIKITAGIYDPPDASNPGQFSYKTYLHRQGVHSACSLRQGDKITLQGHSTGNLYLALGIKIKKYLIAGIDKTVHNSEASVMQGMVLGTYAYLPNHIYRAFSRTGTLHLLAASGFNCVCLILFASFFLKALRIKPMYRNIIVALLILLYLSVVGMKPSMERAAVMACLVLLAFPFRRIPIIKNLLFIAGLLILIIRPTELFDVGFQLSFMAVVALIWLTAEIENAIPLYASLGKSISASNSYSKKTVLNLVQLVLQTAVATIAVTFLTAPIIAYYFNYISTVSLVANVFMVLMVYMIFLTGIVAGLLQFAPFFAAIAGKIGGIATAFSLSGISYLGDGAWSVLYIAPPSFMTIVLYYSAVFILFYSLRLSHVP